MTASKALDRRIVYGSAPAGDARRMDAVKANIFTLSSVYCVFLSFNLKWYSIRYLLYDYVYCPGALSWITSFNDINNEYFTAWYR